MSEKNNETIVGKKVIQLRNLRTTDIFIMSKILAKMNLKITPEKAKSMSIQSLEQAGIEFFKMALENLHLAEKEITEFIADLAGMKPEDFSEHELDEEWLDILEGIKDLKGIKLFFERAVKLTVTK